MHTRPSLGSQQFSAFSLRVQHRRPSECDIHHVPLTELRLSLSNPFPVSERVSLLWVSDGKIMTSLSNNIVLQSRICSYFKSLVLPIIDNK